MKYLLLLTTDPEARPQEGSPEYDAEMERWTALNDDMKQAGVYVVASGFQPPESATTLRAHDGDPVLTDGPFAETKEMFFSFYVIEVSDLDAAAEWAAKMPVAGYSTATSARPSWPP